VTKSTELGPENKRLPFEFWPVFIILLAVLVVYPSRLERDSQLAMDDRRGYRAAANELVERGCLELQSLSNTVQRRSIRSTRAEGCPSKELYDDYAARSPLGSDTAGLIDRRWRISQGIDGERLQRIRANAHPLRFSAEEPERWTESVYFADGPESGMPSGFLWVSGEQTTQREPTCANRRVDGLLADASPELYQYVSCNGRAWQKVERIAALSEETASARRVRYPQLASVLRRLESPNVEGPVLTTIKRDLQRAAQARLEAHLENVETSRRAEQTIRAGVLLMDGLTGEIAAAATYPSKPTHVFPGDTSGRRWLERNWNFERMPVGSTAKIPIGVAIIQALPQLSGRSPTKVNTEYCGSGRIRAICTRRATQSLGVSFERFVTISSNGHALWLIDSAYRSGRDEWYDLLRKFACIEPLEGDGDPSCSGYLWRSDAPGARSERRGIPEPMLELDLRNLRGEAEYVARHLSILGGNRSSWTSANLAQAYARIFSDRAVNPRLTPDDAGELQRTGVERDTWKKVRDGMAGTLYANGGTARALCTSIGCEVNRVGRHFLYAKTGTSTIRERSSRSGETEDGHLLVLLAARTASGRPPQGPDEIESLKVIVLTQRYKAPGVSTLNLAEDLFASPTFRAWLNED